MKPPNDPIVDVAVRQTKSRVRRYLLGWIGFGFLVGMFSPGMEAGPAYYPSRQNMPQTFESIRDLRNGKDIERQIAYTSAVQAAIHPAEMRAIAWHFRMRSVGIWTGAAIQLFLLLGMVAMAEWKDDVRYSLLGFALFTAFVLSVRYIGRPLMPRLGERVQEAARTAIRRPDFERLSWGLLD